MLSTAKLSAVGHRWLSALSTYDFDVQYRPGRHNVDADLLSRNMCEKTDEWTTIPQADDKRVGFQALEIGDRVLLRNLGLKGKHKLESRWGSTPYVVLEKMPNLPVYKVKPEDGKGGAKTLHRDHLLPIGQLVRLPATEIEDQLHVKPRTRGAERPKRPNKTSPNVQETPQEYLDSFSDEEYSKPEKPYRTYLKEVLEQVRGTAEQSNLVSEGSKSSTPSDENSSNDSMLEEEVMERSPTGDGYPDPVEEEGGPESQDEHPVTPAIAPLETHPKRRVKPVIRLTYDEPGRSREQPLNIVHRGVVVKIDPS